MRLRNKRTGEILEVVAHRAGDYRDKFDSLASLNEEWEDATVKDIKYYYCISTTGDVHELVYYGDLTQAAKDKMAIGNYFETREEAEKAVEKLKAWKRLKDKGFRFNGIRFRDDNYIRWNIEPIKPVTDDEAKEMTDDVHLLFGGEK